MNQIPPGSEEATLLVPMHLDALVVNNSVLKMGTTYNRWKMDYNQMKRFENPTPEEFVGRRPEETPPVGVHLHWTLPAGLTHGVEKKPGEIEFPYVPNRWLVVRIQAGAGDSRPAPTAWVVLSDALGNDCTSEYIDPRASQPGNIIPTGLGKKVALAGWQPKPGEEGEPFLTAIAPGNVAFAAFAPGVEDVFAFHDDLSGIDEAKLTYLVVGWYSRPEKMDPLAKLSHGDWQDEFLFNVHKQFRDDLNGQISDVFRQVFLDNKINLSPKLTILKDPTGNTWQIQDKDNLYTARLENDGISIYESTLMFIEDLRWAVKLEGQPPPTRTLLHGLVYEVDWNREGDLAKTIKGINIPDCEGVRIAVGNTSNDALTALIHSMARKAGLEDKIPDDFFDALQYDLLSTLDQVGSKTLLDQQIRQNWFDSEPGGTLWEIVGIEQAETDHELPEISPELEKKLAELNQKQRVLDAERRILNSMQWELYALWWKYNYIKGDERTRDIQPEPGDSPIAPPKPELDSSKTEPPREDSKPGCLTAFIQLLGSLSGKKGQVSEPAASKPEAGKPESGKPTDQDGAHSEPIPLSQSLKNHLDRTIPGSLAGQVAAQMDKVKRLVKDVPHELRSEQQAKDEPTETVSEEVIKAWAQAHLGLDTGKLVLKPSRMPRFWRPTDPVVLIAGLERPLDQGQEGNLLCRLTSSLPDDATNRTPSLPNKNLPGGVQRLLQEAYFADDDPEKAPGRYGARKWKQPWSPLFIDWQVTYGYTFDRKDGDFKKDSAGNFCFSSESWKFDGTDYRWAGSELNLKYGRSYSGRTFLTPHAPINFLERLQKVLQSRPDLKTEAGEAVLEKIARWDILSQTLSGFSDLLILRDLEYTVTPYGDNADLMDEQHQGIPFLKVVPKNPDSAGPYFFPLRAGFLKFEKLVVIDKFGRTLDLLNYANDNPGDDKAFFEPIRGRGMVSSKVTDKTLVELPPRVVQSSRVLFRFVSAADKGLETGLEEVDSNPVCGWLLPNYLDKSISIYQADGSLLGEILRSAGRPARFQPAPGAVAIPNGHLKDMIDALTDREDRGVRFSKLVEVIDNNLWTIDPAGLRDDGNLSVLIGRPLALVRANLQLELCGDPFYNQAMRETVERLSFRLKENHGGLLDLDFPVRLGSQDLRHDGLIGYFQGSDYTTFHAVSDPNKSSEGNQPFIREIGAGDDYVKLKFKATTSDPFHTDGSVYLTMLIDPRGVVHANCGLLPVKTIQLPDRYVSKALKRMAVTFRSGPLLIDPALLDAKMIRLPVAAEQPGAWTWVQAEGTEIPIVKADAAAHFSTAALDLVEGWLKFSPEEIDQKKEKTREQKTS